MKQQDKDRQRIAADTAQFLADGGKITHVGDHVMGEEKIEFVRLPGNMERVAYKSGKKGSLA